MRHSDAERERLSKRRRRSSRTFLQRLYDRYCTSTDVVFNSPNWQGAAAASLRIHGACVVRQPQISAALVQRTLDASLARLDELLFLAREVSPTPQQPIQYRELWSRRDDHGYRFDMKVLPSCRAVDEEAETCLQAMRAEVDAIVQPVLRATSRIPLAAGLEPHA